MRNLANFHPTTQKSKNFTSMGYFCPKYMRFELKKYRGVIFHDTEQWCKIWIIPDLVVSKMACGIGWTLGEYFFNWKISEKLCVMTMKGVEKFKRKKTCSLKSDIRNLVNFHASSWESENLHFDWIRFFKEYKYLDETVQKSYV